MPHLNTQLEEIFSEQGRSISLNVNPDLSDMFFWHFHPELELVYYEGREGIRHVGDHIEQINGDDLVLIGSNIPHLNFDYGVKTPYEKRVIHFRTHFLESAAQEQPELQSIYHLLQLSSHGIAFGEETKKRLRERLLGLQHLDHFDMLLEVMSLLQHMSQASDMILLHENPVRTQHTQKDHQRLKTVYAFVENNYHHPISIQAISNQANMTKEAFCRYFKKMTKLTFTAFLNQYRIDKAKKLLLIGRNVTEACFECGYESLSYFHRVFKKCTGESPKQFRDRYKQP